MSLEAIFLAILILISQNMAAEEDRRRHHFDLQVNLLNEREMTALLRVVNRVAEKLEIEPRAAQEVGAFSQKTDPAHVLHQIVDAERAHAGSAHQASRTSKYASCTSPRSL